MDGYVHRNRSVERPKIKRWMDMIEQDCEMLGLNIYNAGRLAQGRTGWKKRSGAVIKLCQVKLN